MNRIRDLRTGSGWTQAELAQKIGTARTTVTMYERGDRQLDAPMIHALCDIFGCTADYLLGRSEARSPAVSEEEVRLLLAWRAAPDHVKDAISILLFPPSQEKKKVV